MANGNQPTKKMFGRKARTGLEQQAAAITPDLTYQTQAQKKAIADRSDQLQQGIARRAGLEGSGLSTGMSGQNIRLMGTIGAQQLAQEAAVEQRAGGEQRANLQALLGAQTAEDQRVLANRQTSLQETTGLGQLGLATQAQALRGQESAQQFGLQKRAQTEAETSGAAQRRLSEGQLTGQLSDTLDKDAVLQAYMQPDGGFDWNSAVADGIEQDPVTGEFTRKRGTLSERAQAEAESAGAEQRRLAKRQVSEAEAAGASARRLGEAQLTGELEDGDETRDTLAKQQQDIAAESSQSAMELAERQRVDARDVKFAELGQQGTQLAETARQFDAELLQKSTEFSATYGLTDEQFKESKRQFDAGIDLENSKAQAQMNQFNAEQKLRAAELYGGDGLSKPEFLSALGTKTGDTAFRGDLDFNKDGFIDDEDETIFDSSADETGVIRGRDTLAQREAEFQEARFSTEAELQSEKLGIEAQSIKNAFTANQDALDQRMAEMNTAFTGVLYNRGADGITTVTDDQEPPQPLTSVAQEAAMNALSTMETNMNKTVSDLASEMGLVGEGKKYDKLSDVPDEQLFSLMSMLFAARAPGASGIGYSAPSGGGGGGGGGGGFMESMGKVAKIAGFFI